MASGPILFEHGVGTVLGMLLKAGLKTPLLRNKVNVIM